MLLHYYYHGRYYLLIVFLFSYSFCYITCIRCLQKIQHFVFVCVQSQQLPLSLRCQTLLLSKQEVELFRIGDSYSVLSFSRVRQYETIKIRVNIELIMTTCIHRHICTHKDIYLRYCYVTIMSFLNASAKSSTLQHSYSKGEWYTQGNHCLLPILNNYRLIINRACMQINLYIISMAYRYC